MEYNNESSINLAANRQILAALLGVEVVMILVSNSFVVIYTLLHPEQMKKESAVVLLFGLALVNLIIGSFILSWSVVAASTDGTYIGRVLFDKTCMIQGYAATINVMARYDMLALVSIDRFLNIVKPLVHKYYFKPKYAAFIMVSSWLVIMLVASIPFFTTGFNGYLPNLYICYTMGSLRHVITGMLVIVLVIVAVTSIWTFLFTRKFLKRLLSPQQESVESSSQDVDSVYNKRFCKLFGVFSSLVMLVIIQVALHLLSELVVAAVNDPVVPTIVSQIVYVVGTFLGLICMPVVQCYFRKDLWTAICRKAIALKQVLTCYCYKVNAAQ